MIHYKIMIKRLYKNWTISYQNQVKNLENTHTYIDLYYFRPLLTNMHYLFLKSSRLNFFFGKVWCMIMEIVEKKCFTTCDNLCFTRISATFTHPCCFMRIRSKYRKSVIFIDDFWMLIARLNIKNT